MNYLRKKLQAIIASADFKGYLREVTGTDSVTLTDCMGSDMTSLSLVGNAVQDGTPSPDNPVEIQGCGDRTANLFDVSLKYSNPWLSAVIDDSGWVTYDYTNSNDTTTYPAFFTHASAEVKPDTTYTVITEIESISGCQFEPTSIRAAGDMYQGQLRNSQNYYETAGTYVLAANSLSDLSGANCFLTTKLVVAANATAHIKFRLSVLEGSYTAETMPPYEPYGYKIPVEVSGRNLFTTNGRTELQLSNSAPIEEKPFEGNNILLNISNAGHIVAGRIISYTVAGNSVSLTVSNNSGYGVGFDFDVKPGEVYSLSCVKETEYAEASISFYDTNGIYISRWYSYQSPFTVPENGAKMVLTVTRMFVNGLTGTETTEAISNIMLVKGSYTADTIPPYEPYHAPQTFNVYMDKPLYAVGNVGDTITLDFDAKTAVRTNYVGSMVVDGGYGGSTSLNDEVIRFFHTTTPTRKVSVNSNVIDIMSDIFEAVTFGELGIANTQVQYAIAGNPNTSVFNVRVPKSAIGGDTAEVMNAWAANHPATVYYQLATPTTTDISALQDWDAFPSTWRGTVVISADTTIQPSSMAAQYYATQKED